MEKRGTHVLGGVAALHRADVARARLALLDRGRGREEGEGEDGGGGETGEHLCYWMGLGG